MRANRKDINSLIQKEYEDQYELSQNLLQMIYNARTALKKLKVIRTNKLAGADYAEWIVSIITGAKINDDASNEGFDLVYGKGVSKKKIEVKSRMVKDIDKYTEFHISSESDKKHFKCDELYCILLNEKFEILLIMKIAFNNGAFDRLLNNNLIKLNDKMKKDRFTISWSKSRKNKFINFSKDNSDVFDILYIV